MKIDRNPANFSLALFSLPDTLKHGLAELSNQEHLSGKNISLNTCILDALEWFFGLPEEKQELLEIQKAPSHAFTVRMPTEYKMKLIMIAGQWQVKTGKKAPMAGVLNTALALYLKKKLKRSFNN